MGISEGGEVFTPHARDIVPDDRCPTCCTLLVNDGYCNTCKSHVRWQRNQCVLCSELAPRGSSYCHRCVNKARMGAEVERLSPEYYAELQQLSRPERRADIYHEIDAERHYQDDKWGGPDHDSGHTAWDFCFYALKFLGKCAAACMSGDSNEARRQFIKVAALCVAALENVSELQQ